MKGKERQGKERVTRSWVRLEGEEGSKVLYKNEKFADRREV